MSRTAGYSTSHQGFRTSFNQLKEAQKTRRGVPLYLLYVNRPAGRAVAAALRNTGVTPNHVTMAGALVTYGSLLWLALGAQASLSSALVGVLLAIGYVLDSADGQLARLQGTSSAFGEWLDHLLDNGRITVMHVAVFCFLARTTGWNHVLLAVCCGLFLLASSCIFFGGVLLDQLRRTSLQGSLRTAAAAGTSADSGSQKSDNRRLLRRSAVMLPVDYGVTCLAFLLLPWPQMFFTVYLVLAAAHLVMCLAFLPKWRSDLLALG